MRNIILILLATAISSNAFAQSNEDQAKQEKKSRVEQLYLQEEEDGLVAYQKSFAFGLKLNSDGYGVSFELGRAKSVRKSMLYQLEIGERKHPKERKQYASQNTGFIYGKENFVYPVKLGVQQQILLGNKGEKNGVSVTGNYGGGVSLAMLRPYYMGVVINNAISYVKYDSRDSALFLDISSIFSGPTLGKGWSDITVTPGLYGKASVRFDYGTYNELVSAVEVGVTAEFYSKKIPQMVYNEQKQFFISAYVSVLFGKRK